MTTWSDEVMTLSSLCTCFTADILKPSRIISVGVKCKSSRITEGSNITVIMNDSCTELEA